MHHRYSTIVFANRDHLALDKAFMCLHAEATYYYNMLKSPALLTEQIRSREQNRQRTDSTRSVPRIDAPLRQEITPLESPVVPHDLSPGVVLAPVVSNAGLQLLQGNRCPGRDCTSNRNKACKQGVCRVCCVAMNLPCLVAGHNKGKLVESPVVALIDELLVEPVTSRQRLYVLYSHGIHAGTVRAIVPLNWKKKPTSISVRCYTDENAPLEKTYFTARIIHAAKEFFTPSNLPPAKNMTSAHRSRDIVLGEFAHFRPLTCVCLQSL